MLLLVACLLVLCGADTMTLRRSQFDSIQCAGDECHYIDLITRFRCIGDRNTSLYCESDMPLHKLHIKHLYIECDSLIQHCYAELVTDTKRSTFEVLVELFRLFILTVFKPFVAYTHIVVPNTVLVIIESPVVLVQYDYMVYALAILSFFQSMIIYYIPLIPKSTPKDLWDEVGLVLPENVRRGTLLTSKECMKNDSVSLNQIITHCAADTFKLEDVTLSITTLDRYTHTCH